MNPRPIIAQHQSSALFPVARATAIGQHFFARGKTVLPFLPARATAIGQHFFARGKTVPPFLPALLLAVGLCSSGLQAASWADWWLLPDQQGQKLFDRGQFAAAAEVFEDPERRAAAYFRAADFENAAAVYGRVPTAEAAYNRGNALIMLGRYEEAIKSYEKALKLRPGWLEAEQNSSIAQARKEMLAPPDSDDGGTGGQLEADEIVFDDTGRVNKSDQEQVIEAGEALSDEEMRAVWLRRMQSDPADFLRARFSYQLYRDEQQESTDE